MEEKGVPLRLEYFANETVQFLKDSGQFLNVRIIYKSGNNLGEEKNAKPVSGSRYDFVILVEVAKSKERFLGIEISRIFSTKGSYRKRLVDVLFLAGFNSEETKEKDWQWTFINELNTKIHIKPALSLAAYGFVRCFFLIV